MSYAANTLFIAQFSSLSISFITAEFANIGSEYVLAMGTVEIKPDPLPNPVQFRDLSVILIDNQPLPGGWSPVFLISSYGTPLAQRASYLALHNSLFGSDGTVNYDYIITNIIKSLLRCFSMAHTLTIVEPNWPMLQNIKHS